MIVSLNKKGDACKNTNDRIQTVQLINILKNDLQIHRVAPAHCRGHLAFRLLKNIYSSDYLYAGLGETISFK